MKIFNVLNDDFQRYFFLDFKNLFIGFAELQSDLIGDFFVNLQTNYVFVKRLQSVFSKIHFDCSLDTLQVFFLEVFVELRQTAVCLLAEVVQILIDDALYTT